jgi:hypothetical protein
MPPTDEVRLRETLNRVKVEPCLYPIFGAVTVQAYEEADDDESWDCTYTIYAGYAEHMCSESEALNG